MSQHPVRTSAIDAVVTPADELFVNLDGSILKVGGSSWRVEVCGIHTTDQQSWVQVHLVGADEYGVTVATSDLSARTVRGLLLDWLATASARVPVFPTANA